MVDENGDTPATIGQEGTYVLQVLRDHLERDAGDGKMEPWVYWQDVATVTVPARTKRKTAIRRAVEEAGLEVTEDVKVRLLDAESAEVRTVRPKPPAQPELDIV